MQEVFSPIFLKLSFVQYYDHREEEIKPKNVSQTKERAQERKVFLTMEHYARILGIEEET